MLSTLNHCRVILTCRSYLNHTRILSRNMSLLEKLHRIETPKCLVDTSKHKLIYSFPYITLPAGFLRFRFIALPLTVAFLPVAYYVDTSGKLLGICLLTGVVQFAFAVFTAKYLKNIVGRVYVHKDEDVKEVIFSSLNEKGNRVDRYHSPDQLMVNDFKTTVHEALGFVEIGIENSDLEYKLNIKNCKIYDKAAFTSIFGVL